MPMCISDVNCVYYEIFCLLVRYTINSTECTYILFGTCLQHLYTGGKFEYMKADLSSCDVAYTDCDITYAPCCVPSIVKQMFFFCCCCRPLRINKLLKEFVLIYNLNCVNVEYSVNWKCKKYNKALYEVRGKLVFGEWTVFILTIQ
jgi:hypothetical protein